MTRHGTLFCPKEEGVASARHVDAASAYGSARCLISAEFITSSVDSSPVVIVVVTRKK